MITGTSTAVHQRSKTGDIVEANRPFTFGPGPAPWPLPFTFGPGPAPWPLPFTFGPGPAPWPLPFTFGPGQVPWPRPFTFGPGPAPWPRLFSLGPGPAPWPPWPKLRGIPAGIFCFRKIDVFVFGIVFYVFSRKSEFGAGFVTNLPSFPEI